MKSVKGLLILLFSVIWYNSSAQNSNDAHKKYTQFVKDFTQKVYYPVELVRLRKPTACLIELKVDRKKNVLDMHLSDSADSTLKLLFDKHKSELNTSLITSYIRSTDNKNDCKTYIIPLSYATMLKQAPSQAIDLQTFYNYSKFNGYFLTGNVIFLEPIWMESSTPKQ